VLGLPNFLLKSRRIAVTNPTAHLIAAHTMPRATEQSLSRPTGAQILAIKSAKTLNVFVVSIVSSWHVPFRVSKVLSFKARVANARHIRVINIASEHNCLCIFVIWQIVVF